MSKIAVIGSGSWGIALAEHIAREGHDVIIWSFTEEEKNDININKKTVYIPELTINERIHCSNSLEEVVKNAEIILHVTPSKFTRNVFNQYKEFVGNKPVILCSKGFDTENLQTLNNIFEEELPGIRLGVLSGPSFAIEVVNKIPTAIILASKDDELLAEVSKILSSETMRIYKSHDVLGVEIGGALKNIIAFCCGIVAELGLGTNASSAIITRGLAEIARLGVKMGASKDTFYGLSGLGDLILTCSSDESRNRRAGRLIGKGLSIDEIKKEIGMTIESIDNIEIAHRLAEKYNVEMPIVNSVYDVIFNNKPITDVSNSLMTRTIKFENE